MNLPPPNATDEMIGTDAMPNFSKLGSQYTSTVSLGLKKFSNKEAATFI